MLGATNIGDKKNYSTFIFAAIPLPKTTLLPFTPTIKGPRKEFMITSISTPGIKPRSASRDWRFLPASIPTNLTLRPC